MTGTRKKDTAGCKLSRAEFGMLFNKKTVVKNDCQTVFLMKIIQLVLAR